MATYPLPVHTSMPLATASRLIDEILAVRAKEGINPLAVAVLDSGGNLVAFKREDGSGLLRYDIAFGKAWAALGMGVPTRALQDRLAEKRPTFLNALSVASQGRFIPVPSGVLIMSRDGQAIGAIGISGDTSDKDEYCAITAARTLGLATEPAEINPNWRTAG
ncbi:MAG: heme-binding protein [Betaproteobacteria bacterium]|nr:heme-binding protein [Betaproteobacteria bacterium]